MKTSLLIPVTLIAFSLTVSPTVAESLLPQGDFGSNEVGGLPAGWTGHQAAHLTRVNGSHQIVEQEGERFLQLKKQQTESTLLVETSQAIPKGTKLVTLTITDRVIDIIPGSENPNRNVFRVGFSFRDASNQILKEARPQISRFKSYSTWKTESVTYEVPEGAENVSISLALLNCVGTWEIQSVELTAE